MARAFTGRRKVLRFEGGWHGVSDFGLHGARPPRPSAYPRVTADSAGLPATLADDILVAPFNDAAMAAQIIERHGAELAAVCVEPLQRCIRAPRPEFLRTVREATAQSGSILIFDEVVTGFRIAWGGAQERYGVVPDLATYGKTISGGYPAAAICGRGDVLDTVNPWRDPSDPLRTIVSGTFNGNPLCAAAGLATLEELAQTGNLRAAACPGRAPAPGHRAAGAGAVDSAAGGRRRAGAAGAVHHRQRHRELPVDALRRPCQGVSASASR